MIQTEWRPKGWLNWNQAWVEDGGLEEDSKATYERGADRMYKAIQVELWKQGINLTELLEKKK